MEQLKKDRDFNPRPKSLISKNQIVSKNCYVYANLLPVTISKSITTFYCYSVRFEPDIESDFIFKKREVFHSIEKKIGQESNLGNFVYTGDNIYSDKEQKDLKIHDAFHSKTQCKYKIFISLTTEVINLTENNCFRTPAVKTITEEIVKKILRSNVDLEFFRNLFVKTKEKQEIQSYTHKVDFYPGYTTGIHYLADGTHLCVSLKNKILGKENCLEKINTLRSNAEIREFFQERSVKTNYKKNNKNYLISDVNFDLNPGNYKFTHRGKEITMIEYYETVKGCKIMPASLNGYTARGSRSITRSRHCFGMRCARRCRDRSIPRCGWSGSKGTGRRRRTSKSSARMLREMPCYHTASAPPNVAS